jgi:hypothetical protein
VTEGWVPVAAAVSALATLACCLPLGIAGAVGAFGLSVVLDSLRPWLITLSVVLLGIGVFQMRRGRRSCRRSNPATLALLLLSACIVIAVLLFPQEMAELMATLP